jgi:hypothetical protein
MPRGIATPSRHRQQHVPLRFAALSLLLALSGACQRTASQPDAASPSAAVMLRPMPWPLRQAAEPEDAAPAPADAAAPVAEPAAAPVAVPTPAPTPAPPSTPEPAGDGSAGFLGGNDRALFRRVCDGTVERIERNRGGSTISFRVWFEGGARGLFKPQQTADVANFRAELAAYRLSQLLGLHRVPPACGRRMPRARLQQIADRSGDAAFSERVMRELLGRGDEVPGAMLYWVPGPLENVPGTARWQALLDPEQPLAEEDTELAADLARLVIFDFVTDNVDRWSGGNILRQHLPRQEPGPMLFMDNGAAFSVGTGGLGARPREQAERLARVGRLPRGLLTALRALTAESLAAAMREDPLGSALGPQQIQAVLTRRDRVLQHAEALVQARGEAAAMPFP